MIISLVSCQKGLTRHAYAWQTGSFWQDNLHIWIPDKNIDILPRFYGSKVEATRDPHILVGIFHYGSLSLMHYLLWQDRDNAFH